MNATEEPAGTGKAAAGREIAMAAGGERALRFSFTSPEKVMFPATADSPPVTKLEVAAYYHAVAPVLLPHLRGRPMVLRRFPHGIGGEAFFQKNYEQEAPAFVRKEGVWSQHRGESHDYVVVENEETLLWLVQLGCIEVHPWLSRFGDDPASCADAGGIEGPGCGLDYPDLLVFDCDPYLREGRLGRRAREAGGEPGVDPEDFAAAAQAALRVHEALADLGLRTWVKTSGKRGVHVYLPILPRLRFEAARTFAQTFAGHLAARHPDLLTTRYDARSRAGRVFLDVNQNVRGKTLAAPWSLRPTPQATFSRPLRWEDLPAADPGGFTLHAVRAAPADPWQGFARQDLAPVLDP